MFDDDIPSFFADFGVNCKIGNAESKAILDRPEVDLGFGEGVRAAAYVICAAVSDFPDVKVGDPVVSDKGTFKIRSLLKVDDGLLWRMDVL
jgi:hypothetical protein